MGDLYVGLDLHSGNTYMGIMEGESKKRVYQKRHKNNLEGDTASTGAFS